MSVKKNTTIWVGLFVLAMIGVVLMQEIGDTTTKVTTTYTNTNQSLAGTATGVNTTLSGKNFQGTPTVVNRSFAGVNFTTIASGNYTVVQRERSGKQVVEFQLLTSTFANQPLNITYTWEPEGYVSNSAGRNMVTLILIILAVGLLIWVVANLFEMDGLKNLLNIGRR